MKTQAQIAEELARKYHEGQTRHDRITPYIIHIEGVVENIKKIFNGNTILGFSETDIDNTIAAGWLHDILENCKITIQELADSGINDDVIEMVKVLTHDKEVDTYEKYVENAINYSFGTVIVKYCDMQYNINDEPTMKQLIKYANTLLAVTFKSYTHINNLIVKGLI